MVDYEDDIKNCIVALTGGGTILYPTDTVWGLGCNAMDEQAVNKIYTIKERLKEKSLIVLLADARDIIQYVAAPPPDIIAIIEDFKEPTTVIYEGALGFADNVINHDGSIAIRVTTDPFCKALIKRFRKPIVSTSANISGAPTPAIYSQVAPAIIQQAGYTVGHRKDSLVPAKPSRLIKINEEGDIEVLRA